VPLTADAPASPSSIAVANLWFCIMINSFRLSYRVQVQGADRDIGVVGDLWVVIPPTPCSANSSIAAALIRSRLSCFARSRRPIRDPGPLMTTSLDIIIEYTHD
jgi:hypothetical protein